MENYYCPSLPNDSVTEILVRLPVKSLLRFRSVSKNWYSLIAIPYFEILLRLPVKFLLRFKSVCKNWYSLITSSCFIEKHHHHKENPTCHLITVYNQNPSHIIIYVLPEKILPDVALEKHIYLQIPVQFKIVGPLDGIFFLYKESHIMALWNPATKEFRPLPLPDFLPFIPSSLSYINNIFGFGFDPLSRDYKVVWISFCYDNDRSNPRVWFASVYSLGKDCWRNVTCNFDAKPSMVQSSCSTYVNGFYYWCASRHNEQVLLIRFFDMHNEVFGEIPSPGDLSRGDDFELTIYKESICLLVRHLDLDDDSNPPIDLWLMDDKRVWIKVLNVMPTRIELLNVVPDHISGCVPLGFWGHDKFIIFLSSEGRIILYDFKTQKFTHLLNTHDELYNCSALSYRESLVSIKGKNVCHRQGDILDFIQEYFKDYEEE